MLVQTEKTTAQRNYESEVETAFRRYVEATPPGTSDLEQADARRHYVDHVHAIRRRWHEAFEHVGVTIPAWLPSADRPIATVASADEGEALFECVAVLVYDAETDSFVQ